MIDKRLRILVIITSLCTILLLCLVLFYHLYAPIPIETSPAIFPIVSPKSKIVCSGDIITYGFQYKKYTNDIPVTQRQFVDGIVFNISNSTPAVAAKGSGHVWVETVIPTTLPPGKYRIKIISIYQLNPIKQYVVEHITEEFTVVEKEIGCDD